MGKGGNVTFHAADEETQLKDVSFVSPHMEVLRVTPSGTSISGIEVSKDFETYWLLRQWLLASTAKLGKGRGDGKDASVDPLEDSALSHRFETGRGSNGDPDGEFIFRHGDHTYLRFSGLGTWSGHLPGFEVLDPIDDLSLVYQLFATWVRVAHTNHFGARPDL